MSIVTRFAPSPTGYLHIGGARTALFSWLVARKNKGKFILRIEDTDRERSTREAVDVIIEGMNWLGLDFDQEPIYQSDRFPRYQQIIDQLLASGHAYKCYCSKEELDRLREQQMLRKEKPRYNRKCRTITSPPEGKENIQPVIRFKTPLDGQIVIQDHIKGQTTINNSELDDVIISRSDGTPTYNFVVVVDDLDMGLTHIIRGDDHYNNTPRQINILNALNGSLPEYAHLPMILDEKGAKLSKRHGAANLLNYREQGYLPEALLNYLVRLGWSHGDQEIFSIEEMIELFDLKDVNSSASSINPDKLLWLNQEYLKNNDPKKTAPHLQYQFDLRNIDNSQGPALTDLIPVMADRCQTLAEMADSSIYFFQDFTDYDEKAAKKNLKSAAIEPLSTLLAFLTELMDWNKESIHQAIIDTTEKLDIKMGKIGMPLRVAVTGGGSSPSIDITLELLGKEKSIERISKAIKFIQEKTG